MPTIREHLKILTGGGDKKETERLDRFLDRFSDTDLLQSLRQDERRRSRMLAAAALVLGLLIGGGGAWLAGSFRAAPASQASSTADERAEMLVSEASRLVTGKHFEKAWAYLDLATGMAPNLVRAWDTKALAKFYGGQTVEAEQAARRCLEINPGYNRAYHLLGDFSFYAGDDLKLAKEYWRRAGARRGLARVALLEGRFREAVPVIRELAREVPDDPYLQVMDEAVRLGRLTPELRQKLQPTYVASRNPDTALGWRLFYSRRYDEAAVAFNRALQRERNDGSAILGRGWCLLRVGTPATAREAQSQFEQVLGKWPSNYSALNGLAWSRKTQGQAEGALKLWERVLSLPHRPHVEISESLKGLGLVYHEREDDLRASSYLGQSFTLNPYDPETEKLLNESLHNLQLDPSRL